MKQTLLFSLLLFLSTSLWAQVGIGTSEPKAFLNVPAGRTVLFGADTVGTDETENTFPKLIWYGSKGAFRAGGVSSFFSTFQNWDYANSGRFSFASGIDTKASGDNSTAMVYHRSQAALLQQRWVSMQKQAAMVPLRWAYT